MKSFKEIMFEGKCKECGKTPCECKKEKIEEAAKPDFKTMIKKLKKEFPHLEDEMSDDEILMELVTFITNNPDSQQEIFQAY